jgi:hypothetical protein
VKALYRENWIGKGRREKQIKPSTTEQRVLSSLVPLRPGIHNLPIFCWDHPQVHMMIDKLRLLFADV